jgi:fatty-acyl-CoA synthase
LRTVLIGDILRRQAAPTGRPDKPALLFEGRPVTFAGLNARANRLANALLGLGLAPGDRVALLGRNSPAWVAAYYAAAKCGAVLVPVNFWYRAGEIGYALRDSGARFCLVAAAHAAAASELRAGPDTPAVERWIWLDERPQGAVPGDRTVAELVAGAAEGEPEPPGGRPDEHAPHIILYTSGTTGFPKGALLSHRAHVQHAMTFALHTGATEEDVYLNVYPLFHTGGTDCAVLPYHLVGATVALLPDPKAEAVLDALERYRVTAMMAVPTIWRRLVETLAAPATHSADAAAPRRDLTAFKRAMGSSDAMPLDLLQQVMETFGATWTQTYGLTEAGCILTYLPPADHTRKLGSAGKPHAQADLVIADASRAGEPSWPTGDGHRLPPGQAGEVVARTEHVMNGYWNKPEQTAAALVGAGADGAHRRPWLRTGDVGYLDEEGYLFIAGRLKDVIISGGEKIYPAEVEPALAGYPGVAELALVGVPDREWGESVLAVVVLDDSPAAAAFDGEAFKRWARGRVAGFKTPQRVEVVDALPRTSTGKVQKAILRDRFAKSGAELRVPGSE